MCKWHLCVLITSLHSVGVQFVPQVTQLTHGVGTVVLQRPSVCYWHMYVLPVSLPIFAYITYAGISLPSRLGRYLPEVSSIRSGLFVITRSRLLPLQSCAKQ